MEVAVPPDRRAGTSVTRSLPVVLAFLRAGGQRLGRHALRQLPDRCRQIVEDPMDPRHLRGPRIRRIGIVDDEGEALSAIGRSGPRELWGSVVTFACVPSGYLSLVRESRGSEREWHG